MHAVVVYLSVLLSVCACVSITLRYCVKTAKRMITQIMTHDMPGTLVIKWDVLYHSCRISTDKRVAHSLCHTRASCLYAQLRIELEQSLHCTQWFAINRVLDDGYWVSHLCRSTLVLHTLRLKLHRFDFSPWLLQTCLYYIYRQRID